MNVIVIYKSRYGSTRGIAEFIAEKLREHGVKAEARSVDTALDIEEYDAVVIGSAVYMEHWMKEAAELVRRNRAVLAGRPVWLFSSGPLELEPGTSLDEPGRPGTGAQRDRRVSGDHPPPGPPGFFRCAGSGQARTPAPADPEAAGRPCAPSRGGFPQPGRHRGLDRRHCADAGNSLTVIEKVKKLIPEKRMRGVRFELTNSYETRPST